MARGKRSQEQHVDDALNDVYLESSLRSSHKRKRKLQKVPLGRDPHNAHRVQPSILLPDMIVPDAFDQDWAETVHHDLGRLPVRSSVRTGYIPPFLSQITSHIEPK